MRKKLKIFFSFLFAFALFTLGNTVHANTISSISMDIFIDNDGTA